MEGDDELVVEDVRGPKRKEISPLRAAALPSRASLTSMQRPRSSSEQATISAQTPARKQRSNSTNSYIEFEEATSTTQSDLTLTKENVEKTCFKYWEENYKDNVVFFDDILYYFNGFYWEKTTVDNLKFDVINRVVYKICGSLDENDVEAILSAKILVVNTKNIDAWIKTTANNKKSQWKVDGLQMDSNPYYFLFENRVFNTKDTVQVNSAQELRLSSSSGYNWLQPSDSDIEEVNCIINKFTCYNPDHRQTLLAFLSTALTALPSRHMLLLLGQGSNGKTAIIIQLLKAFGNYATCVSSSLFAKNKDGPNQELAGMDNKRLGLCTEFNNKVYPFDPVVIKQLVGNSVGNARGLHSKKTTYKNTAKYLVAANYMPDIAGEMVDYALFSRIMVLQCKAEYVTDPTLVDEANHVYFADANMSEESNTNRLRCAWIRVLLSFVEEHPDVLDNFAQYIPESVKMASAQALSMKCPVYRAISKIASSTRNEEIGLKKLTSMVRAHVVDEEIYPRATVYRKFDASVVQRKVLDHPYYSEAYDRDLNSIVF
jgi:hypothetical protein